MRACAPLPLGARAHGLQILRQLCAGGIALPDTLCTRLASTAPLLSGPSQLCAGLPGVPARNCPAPTLNSAFDSATVSVQKLLRLSLHPLILPQLRESPGFNSCWFLPARTPSAASPPTSLSLSRCQSAAHVNTDTVSERLRRWTRNPLGSARRGSNPLGVAETKPREGAERS